jgi:hypothetical protein
VGFNQAILKSCVMAMPGEHLEKPAESGGYFEDRLIPAPRPVD